MRAYRKWLLGAGWVLGLGISGVAAAMPPVSQEQEGATVGENHGEKPVVDPDKRVCKKSMVTGSRFAKVVCHTQAQWDDMAQGTRSQMREIDSMRVNVNGQAGADSSGP